ncbi:MAG: formate dehydrogenase subunit delta [Nitratireductor sp.]|nr:formate dehydrogenase subunit delta [Nitratireductor sp.]MCB1454769.1 formate dehydrogenase subunit delta [Nitratireductor sp.]MCB1458451.1 formate dehydrogenase subunit delta [Nitratireductor sp.]
MSPDKMIYMANQIATFFKTQPGTDQAERVASHLRDFWEPRMRQQLQDYVKGGGQGLDEVAVKAAQMLQ